MSKGHFKLAGASIEYGDAGFLFPVDELDAAVLQYRDAQLALANVDGANVILIAPTNFVTSYFPTQHALTAIRVDSLSTTTQSQINDELDCPLNTFELIQISKWERDSSNQSLTEFTTPEAQPVEHGIRQAQQHITIND